MGNGPVPDAQSLGPLPRPNPRIAARVIQGEAMLLTPHDSVLHTLNPVATRIWQLLPGHTTLEGLVAALAEEYDAEPTVLREDVQALIAALVEKRILE